MTVSSSRQEYIEAAKAAFINFAIKQAIKSLTTKYVFLAWGPVAQIFAMLVEKIIKEAVEGGDTAVFFVYIDLRVNKQEKAFSAAAIENYRIQQSGTQEEKNEAEKKLVAAFDDFVKFTRY